MGSSKVFEEGKSAMGQARPAAGVARHPALHALHFFQPQKKGASM
jgi:hypothetical protein